MSMEELTLVQEFMSEDFFTSDARKGSFTAFALALRAQFEQEADEDGAATPLSAWSTARGDLQKQLLNLPQLPTSPAAGQSAVASADARAPEDVAAVAAFYRSLLQTWGYRLPAAQASQPAAEMLVRSGSAEAAPPLLVVFAAPVESRDDLLAKDDATLLVPTRDEDSGEVEHLAVSRLLSARFYGETDRADTHEEPPAFALVLAGHHIVLTEQERWAEGRYIDIDLGLILDRHETKAGGAVDRMLACTSAAAVAPGPDGTTWFTSVLEESVKHTESVSEDLREAVRTSIEIIANEVVHRRRALGLTPLPQSHAQELAKQSLRYLYRILFLLYAEASPELQVVPTGTTEYEAGYSVDRLRDLALVDVPTKPDGTHLFESLDVLVRLINTGHNEHRGDVTAEESPSADTDSLVFHGLTADLFAPQATTLIDGDVQADGTVVPVRLGNAALQQVLQRLLLSKEKKGRQRGFISYAELGINQLGRVYEGLMSYSGFFAEEPLWEVAKNGDSAKGSWVVPVDRAESIADGDFVMREDPTTGERTRVRYDEGEFVFRLSGRERQRSASFYTPEVLTRFTVSQALAELLTDDHSADDILHMTVCEPALGSGAFALEGVRQLAAAYLTRKQDELDQKIDPADYGRELQKAKAFIALHNVYGVDLNATAVELAEISLWLDTMVAGLSAPWFGLRLRRGNSLIGARRSVYSREQVKESHHLSAEPTRVGGEGTTADLRTRRADDVYQFLLPSPGWGATADSKEGKTLAPDRVKELKDWRKGARRKLQAARGNVTNASSFKQVERLQALSVQVDLLWKTAERRLRIAEQESQRSIHVWGQPDATAGGTVTRAQIEAKLADENGAYRRLRRVMDAWCALWFWPLTVENAVTDPLTGQSTRVVPPTMDEWIEALEELLGKPQRERTGEDTDGRYRQADLVTDASWDELNDIEENQLLFSGAQSVARVKMRHPWLAVVEEIAQQQAFFHWELEFPTVFAAGGFDLQLGNPPWVRPRTDTEALLAEGDPWWQLALKPSEAQKREMRQKTLELPGVRKSLLDGDAEVVAQAEFLGDPTTYPLITGTQPDLYRCFMEQTWSHAHEDGIVTLIHPESHFTDDNAQNLRRATYTRLRRHWQFINELMLYEIHHLVSYGVHVYAAAGASVDFLHATSLYHPSTIERSLVHNGEGPEPGLKDEKGRWDVRAHASRIQHVDDGVLRTWAATIETPDTPHRETKMVYTVSEASASVLSKLSSAQRLGSLEPQFSSGWHESADRKRGRFELKWGAPDSWDDVILQGPHFHVGNPFYKQPNATMKHNQDWSSVDLEHLAPDAIPVTSYKPIHDGEYDAQYTTWEAQGEPVSAREFWRVSWRMMAATTGERTLIPIMTPPRVAHPNGVHSMGLPDGNVADVVLAAGSMSSLLADFSVRATPKSNIYPSIITGLPRISVAEDHAARAALMLRVLRLNSLTQTYAPLWEECWSHEFVTETWTRDTRFEMSIDLNDVGPQWTLSTPLRLAADRRQALVEIDALVALMLGVTADELCTVYRSQFPVLYGYDRGLDRKTQYWYDQNGRLVPITVRKAWQSAEEKGYAVGPSELVATNDAGYEYTYAPPFTLLDREADMRAAYAEFERRLTAHD